MDWDWVTNDDDLFFGTPSQNRHDNPFGDLVTNERNNQQQQLDNIQMEEGTGLLPEQEPHEVGHGDVPMPDPGVPINQDPHNLAFAAINSGQESFHEPQLPPENENDRITNADVGAPPALQHLPDLPPVLLPPPQNPHAEAAAQGQVQLERQPDGSLPKAGGIRPPRARSPWYQVELDILQRNFGSVTDDETIRQLNALGLPRRARKSFSNWMPNTGRTVTVEEINDALYLRGQGFLTSRIMDYLGISRPTVNKMFEANLPENERIWPVWTDDEDRVLREGERKNPGDREQDWANIKRPIYGRSVMACQRRYEAMHRHLWHQNGTRVQNRGLITRMRDNGRTWAEVAEHFQGIDGIVCRLWFENDDEYPLTADVDAPPVQKQHLPDLPLLPPVSPPPQLPLLPPPQGQVQLHRQPGGSLPIAGGIRTQRIKAPWYQIEVDILQRNFGNETVAETIRQINALGLPRRNATSVRTWRPGTTRKLTVEKVNDVLYLRRQGFSASRISDYLVISLATVNRMTEPKLPESERTWPVWTDDEDRVLREGVRNNPGDTTNDWANIKRPIYGPYVMACQRRYEAMHRHLWHQNGNDPVQATLLISQMRNPDERPWAEIAENFQGINAILCRLWFERIGVGGEYP